MISLPNPKSETFAEFCANADARNTIELNIRKYTLMLCNALEDNFKSRNRGQVGLHDAPEYKFVIECGRKYHKIIMEVPNHNRPASRSVHAFVDKKTGEVYKACLLYTSPSPRDRQKSRMPSSA